MSVWRRRSIYDADFFVVPFREVPFQKLFERAQQKTHIGRTHRLRVARREVMTSASRLVIAGAFAIGLGTAGAAAIARRSKPKYVLHVYDHCPFCNRVEWLMQHYGISYERVLYGYGAGADPKKCDGHGYGTGPLPLTGKKMLPVLCGEGVPSAPGASGMPESMEICSFLIAKHGLVVPCDSGREDVKKFTAELTALKPISSNIEWCECPSRTGRPARRGVPSLQEEAADRAAVAPQPEPLADRTRSSRSCSPCSKAAARAARPVSMHGDGGWTTFSAASAPRSPASRAPYPAGGRGVPHHRGDPDDRLPKARPVRCFRNG